MTLLFLFRLILSDVEIIQEMWRELILLRYRAIRFLQLKPRANARNIVGQQLLTLLDVTCCVRLHTLLHVVGSCRAKFETVQTFSYVRTEATTVPTMLKVVSQQRFVRLHRALLRLPDISAGSPPFFKMIKQLGTHYLSPLSY